MTPDQLAPFHKLDNALLPKKRPSPIFNIDAEISPDNWFEVNKEQKESKLDITWLLTRKYDTEQVIPTWAAFNETISLTDSRTTTPGMLPILQAPADDNNTVVTVINRFIEITTKLGQPYTVIAMDQPLYSKAKELVWANQEKYQDVVLLMGHLHILFNFLRAIGQHMENTGLVDIWVESGAFAEGSTDAMMESKAYYRAVRGHTLTYEALWQIYWTLFSSWLNETGKNPSLSTKVVGVIEEFSTRTQDNDDVQRLVSEVMEVLDEENIIKMTEEFDKEFADIPNFVLWRTYMKMVETMLEFIRANRDGDWHLHLNSFAAMLPWMTIYDHTNYARWGPVYLAEMKGLETSHQELYEEFMNGNFVVKKRDGKFNQVPIDQATEWQNKICKISNGIIGITRNDTARDKFCIT